MMTSTAAAAADTNTRRSRWGFIAPLLRTGIGAVLVYWLFRTGAIDGQSLKLLAQAWPIVAAGAVVLLFSFLITVVRLLVLCRPTGIRVTLPDAIRLTVVGIFFSLVLPGAVGGDVIRIWYATRGNAGRRAEVVAIFLLDRVMGLFTLVLLPLIMLVFFPAIYSIAPVRALAGAAALVLVALLAGFAIVLSERLRRSALVTWCFTHLPLGSSLAQMVDAVQVYRSAPGALLGAVVISGTAQSLAIAATVLLARVLLVDAFDWSVIVLIPLGFLANAIPVTPGGLGVGEAAFDSLFHLAGLSQGAAVLIGWRLLMLVPAAIGLIVYLSGRRQFVTAVGNSDDPDIGRGSDGFAG